MREYADRRGWQIVAEIKEVGSGALQRPKREELLTAVRRREVDAILVWRLDRWGRSLPDLIITLKELAELGIGFVSLTEAFDMTTPTGRALARNAGRLRGVRARDSEGTCESRHRSGARQGNHLRQTQVRSQEDR
jgi:DNA invertase Pin-like site-specific DNA recombinase